MDIFIILITLGVLVIYGAVGVMVKEILAYNRTEPINYDDFPCLCILFWPLLIVLEVILELVELVVVIRDKVGECFDGRRDKNE